MTEKSNPGFWAQEQKNMNVNRIHGWIIQAHKGKKTISKSKLINVIIAEIGCSNSKAKEYLQILEGKGSIRIDGDIIVYTQKQEKLFEKEFDEMVGK
jgi:hypothetical protein